MSMPILGGPSPALAALILSLTLLINPASAAAAVVVGDAGALVTAIEAANAGGEREILLEDATYTLDDYLPIWADGVTVRGLSGARESVVIEGQGMGGWVTHIFNVAGSDFHVEDLTLRGVSQHAVQIHQYADRPILRNLVIQDTGEQMVKGSYDPGDPAFVSDDGLIEGCLFEYTAGIGPDDYIGGIDCHAARNWVVRGNQFRFIRSPYNAEAEHAIHFWSGASGTLIEQNLIMDCDRGIGLGLGDRGHVGGIVRNNMIYHRDYGGATDFGDVGIGLESATGASVYNNTIWFEHAYPNAIEYRFPSSSGNLIVNNLTNRAIAQRDSGGAEVSHNRTDAALGWLVDPAGGDLHLSGAVAGVVDAGRAVEGLTNDYDGRPRPQGPGIDIGAHEWPVASAVFLPTTLLDIILDGGLGSPDMTTCPAAWDFLLR